MQHSIHLSSSSAGRRRRNERGVALIITLLLLLLLVGLSLAMAFSTNSDLLMSSSYRNFRGSFYAADSGLNIVRQDMINQVRAAVPATFNPGTQPIPPGTTATVLAFINNTYGNNYASGKNFLAVTGSGQTSASWSEKFQINPANTVFAPNTTAPNDANGCHTVPSTDPNTGAALTCSAPGVATEFDYQYNYAMTSVGQSIGNEAATLNDSGVLTFKAIIVPATSKINFAGYGMFINSYTICSGDLVPGTISGPVFTNGAWTFSSGGAYTFTDPVGSVSTNAGYDFGNNNCDQQNQNSDTKNGVTIAPTFQAGFNRSQQAVPLPTDSFNQERAVLDGVGTAGQPQPADLNAHLNNAAGTAYPNNNNANTGVWLPYTPAVVNNGVTVTPATFTGGGFLVNGDAKVQLSTVGTLPAAISQVYQITQGSGNGATVTTITVTPTVGTPGAGTTTVTTVNGAGTTLVPPLTIQGVPVQRDPASNAVTSDAAMLYVNGNVTGLSGPGEGLPAVQDQTLLTITSSATVTITGDILDKSQPINIPADTVNNAGDTRQALGIFTANGDIQLNNSQADQNLSIDASLAMLCNTASANCTPTDSSGNQIGLVNKGAQIKTLNIVGGRIQNGIQNINTVTRNVYFDRRFGASFGPPWFPSTTITTGKDTATTTATTQRSGWLNVTSTN